MNYADLHVDTLLRWSRDPIAFVRENFKAEPDQWQREVLELWGSPDPKVRISLQACVGPGKTCVEAWCGWHGLATKGDEVDKCNGLATAITGDNLRDNLWKEFAKWQGQSQFLSGAFTWTSTRIFANGYQPTWFLGARAWPKTGNADEMGKTLSGLHSRYVMVFADESGAIPVPVMRAGEQALSACLWGRILQAGNPISLEGMLYAAASQFRHLWKIIRVTGDPDDPRAWVNNPRALSAHEDREDCACSRCWSAQQIEAYGRDNPWVAAYILGEFPKGTLNTLLSTEDVEQAMRRTYRAEQFNFAQKRFGIDVARFGDDRSVIFPRQGLAAFHPIVMRHARTTEIAARAAVAAEHWRRKDGISVEMMLVDDTGHWGAGVIDQLLAARLPAVTLNYAAAASDKRYSNVRTEMWFQGADWVKAGGALPHLPELVAELTMPTYSFVGGKLQLEPKDMLKKRLGRSPDLADALFETHVFPDQPAASLERVQPSSHAKTDFDPFAIEEDFVSGGRARIDFDPFAG